MLSRKNLASKPGRIKKLSPKFIGPSTVVKKFAQGRAYLPPELRGIHRTFHISLHKKCEPDNFGLGSDKATAAARKNFMTIDHLLNPETKKNSRTYTE